MTDERVNYQENYIGTDQRNHVLTHDDRQWIIDAIIKHHNCPFGADDFRAVQKILDIHRTMGDGDLNMGIERFRDHSRFMAAVINKKTVIAGAGIVAIIGFLAVELSKKVIAALWP